MAAENEVHAIQKTTRSEKKKWSDAKKFIPPAAVGEEKPTPEYNVLGSSTDRKTSFSVV